MTIRQEIANRVAQLLQDGCVIIDLETTGMSDDPDVQIIEVAIIDQQGNVLINTLVRPQGFIPAGASRVNNIYDADVADKPTWPEVYPQVAEILTNRVAVAYNSTFEEAVLNAVCRRHNLPPIRPREWWCPMRAYQAYTGATRYVRLTDACAAEGIRVQNAHRALGDIRMTLALMQKMAEGAGPIQPSLF
ncbi:MAG: 3'-5' exonuclease [Anaerolineae bacterium]